MKKYRYGLSLLILIGILVTFIVAGTASGETKPAEADVIYRGVLDVVNFDVSPRLDSIAPADADIHAFIDILDDFQTGLEGPLGPQSADTVVQGFNGIGEIPDPIVSFNGPTNTFGVSPPDPNGDVGLNHVVIMSNLSFAVYDKTGTLLFGPVATNTLWSGFGGDCQTDNSGDPVVVYDQFADRWLLTQFTASGPTYFECLAISQTGDPTGAYYRYAISTGSNFPDYPKVGVWDDGYYVSTREFAGSSFAGVGAYAIDKSEAISGDPSATVIGFLAAPGGTPYNLGDGLLPSDADGNTLPPAGSPNYFVGSMDNGGPYGAPQDALTIWEFDTDFTTPANSSFTLAATVPVAPFDSMLSICAGRSCIPQPGTTNKLDHLGYRQRPIFRLAYRNFGDHEALVTNQSVEAAPGMSGNRWWEIRDPGGSPFIYQEGTYAPGVSDGIHRWMGSIAMDGSGNMALGYSASNASTFPSIWYTGRLASDPLGTMPQGEAAIVNGTGSQTGSQRWGDYSSMSIDPTDDCTFWFTSEWVPTSSSVGWVTRIGSFRFDECGSAGGDFTVSASPTSQAICAPNDALFNVTVGQLQGFNSPVTLSASGNPGGTSTGFSTNPVTPPDSSTLTIGNTGAASFGSYNVSVVGTSVTKTHTATVTLDVFTAIPGAPTLTSPSNGATGVGLLPSFTWSAGSQSTDYLIEIATDSAFNNIVDSAVVNVTNYTTGTGLNAGTVYYWHVKPMNECGTGTASATFSFTTADLYCRAPNLAIPDNTPAGVNDVFVIGDGGTLLDLDISIDVTHTWVGDLIFTLTHQDTGTSVVFFDRPGVPASTFGCSGDDIDATLNDGAASPVENECGAGVPTIQGSFIPNNALSAFNGEDLSGTWILNASDNASGDLGTVNGWCLAPETEPVVYDLFLPIIYRQP